MGTVDAMTSTTIIIIAWIAVFTLGVPAFDILLTKILKIL